MKVGVPLPGSVNTPHLSNDRSTGQSESSAGQSRDVEADFSGSRSTVISHQSVSGHSMGGRRERPEKRDEKDSGFTAITEMKATEAKSNSLDKKTYVVTAHMLKPSPQTTPPALEGDVELKEIETIRTRVKDEGGGLKTSSEQQQAGGTDESCHLVSVSYDCCN